MPSTNDIVDLIRNQTPETFHQYVLARQMDEWGYATLSLVTAAIAAAVLRKVLKGLPKKETADIGDYLCENVERCVVIGITTLLLFAMTTHLFRCAVNLVELSICPQGYLTSLIIEHMGNR